LREREKSKNPDYRGGTGILLLTRRAVRELGDHVILNC
jgi:hypothetical protein